MEEKRPRWENEKWTAKEPEDDIKCRDCFLREPDRYPGAGIVIKGYKLSICQAYDFMKPDNVLWEGGACPYYVDEKESENADGIDGEKTVIGAIVGDIVGSVYEFNNIKTKEFPLFKKGCFATDDSIMTLAIAKAVIESDSEHTDLGANAVKYMQEIGRPYPHCGYGGNFGAWIFSNDPQPYNSFGNGSAMRVSSVAYAAKSLAEAEKMAKLVTEVTHNHPEGIKGAKATAGAVWLALNGASKEDIGRYVKSNYYKLDFTLDEIIPTYMFNEICQDTVPQAIEAFLEANSFEDALRNAISIGGDSDTLAAITCSIAGAYWGVPKNIADEAKEYLDDRLKKILIDFDGKYCKFPENTK